MKTRWLLWNGLTVLIIFLLTVAWEFALEDVVGEWFSSTRHVESDKERWEYVFTSVGFVVVALIVPTLLALRSIDRREKLAAELKSSQDQLAHAEKMAAVGKLSASMAHEINNPLFGIRNVLEKLREEAPLEAKHRRFAELAIDECNRIHRLIQQLNEFHRPSSLALESLNIHDLIEDLLVLLGDSLERKRIRLVRNYDASLPPIQCVPDQIKQVLLNLLQNAEEAIEDDGGEIAIRTGSGHGLVWIDLEDTGHGIAPENLGRIFEPFFTTKAEVKGIGLGLSVSYGIIRAHGGDIHVDSRPGEGTHFRVTLPIAASPA